MDFIGIAAYLFDLLLLQLLPFIVTVLVIVGIIGVITRLPDTLTNYARDQWAKMSSAFKRR